MIQTLIDVFRSLQSHRKDSNYNEFKGEYFKFYTIGLGILAFIGCAAWVVKDIFILGTSSIPIELVLRLAPAILLLGYKYVIKHNKHMWVWTLLIVWAVIICNIILDAVANPVAGLSGEGWVTYYVFFFAIGIIANSQLPILISHIVYSLLLVLTAQQYGGPIPYIVDITRPVSTGLILSAGLQISSIAIRYAFVHFYDTKLSLEAANKLDILTGLYNRHILDDITYNNEFLEKQSTIVMCDIDNFKGINDIYGHIEGDEAIIWSANALKSICDENDVLVRFGGDEFIIVFDGIKDEKEVFNKVQNCIKHKNNKYNITFSMGMFKCYEDLRLYKGIKKADLAAYNSKNTGRNRISVYNEHILLEDVDKTSPEELFTTIIGGK